MPATAWAGIPAAAESSSSAIQAALEAADWNSGTVDLSQHFAKWHNPKTVALRISGKGGATKFNISKWVFEHGTQWVFGPNPKFYLFKPARKYYKGDFENKMLAVRTCASICDVQATHSHTIDTDYVFNVNLLHDPSRYIGTITVDRNSPVRLLRKCIQNKMGMLDCSILNLIQDDGMLIRRACENWLIKYIFKERSGPYALPPLPALCDRHADEEPPQKRSRLRRSAVLEFSSNDE